MKQPTFAPVYVALYPALSEIARSHGYALTIHGTVSRDFDLVAIPWVEEVSAPEVLVKDIAERVHAIYDIFGTGMTEVEQKPHGRQAWFILTGAGSGIDISVMPATLTKGMP